MNNLKNLGIYMDHMNAHLMEYTNDPVETMTIHDKFSHIEKEETLSKSESLMHNKEQHEQASYYKALGEIILKYEHVLLFGPTEAKEELFNLLTKSHLYSKIKIEVAHSDKLTENQQHAFVKAHFKNYMNRAHV